MGLDFTRIKDGHGAALFLLYHRSSRDQRMLENLQREVQVHTRNQVAVLDVSSSDGERIRDFYDIPMESLPAALIVKDDDSVHQMWLRAQLPSSEILSHTLKQIG